MSEELVKIINSQEDQQLCRLLTMIIKRKSLVYVIINHNMDTSVD